MSKGTGPDSYFHGRILLYVYAALDDIRSEQQINITSPGLLVQTYDNLIRDKDTREQDLEGQFILNAEVKQFFTFIFNTVSDELQNTSFTAEDSLDSLLAKVEVSNTECFMRFVVYLADKYEQSLGPKLRAANDPSQWLYNKFIGAKPEYSKMRVIFASVADKFETFLKVMAWRFGIFVWYFAKMTARPTITTAKFLEITAVEDKSVMTQTMQEFLESCLREKKPVVKTGAKKKKKEVAGPTETKSTDIAPTTASPEKVEEGDLNLIDII